MTALEVRDVGVALGGATVLRGVSLALGVGEWAALIGPNGAGKSTLLRAIAGTVESAGTVVLGGADAAGLSRAERARRVALVPQSPVVPAAMTVREYVLLGRTPHVGAFARERRSDREAADAAIERLDLRGFAAREIATLSGGERQRAVLARAVAQEADVLLLDEPTSALDIGRQQHVLELVDGLRRDTGLTVLAAMHDLTLAAQYASRLLLLAGGELIAAGAAADVLQPELLSSRFGASLRVVNDGGELLVLPAARPRRESPCAR